MDYLFIDESGDIGFKGSNYLILAALLIENDKRNKSKKILKSLDIIIKNMRVGKFKKQLKNENELKGSVISPKIITHSIDKLNEKKNQVSIYITILNKKNINYEDNVLLYDYAVSKIAKNLKPKSNLEICIDKSKSKKQIKNFNNTFKENFSSNYKININHEDSTKKSGLQFADIIAWSYFQKYEKNNSYYTDLIKISSYIIEI